MKNTDTLLVGWDRSHGSNPVLIVGRKAPGDTADVVNQFEGKDADAIYRTLVNKTTQKPEIIASKEIGSSVVLSFEVDGENFQLPISVVPSESGQTYMELPDGLRLVFGPSGYEGHYNPELNQVLEP